jgi:hypothetical protein
MSCGHNEFRQRTPKAVVNPLCKVRAMNRREQVKLSGLRPGFHQRETIEQWSCATTRILSK